MEPIKYAIFSVQDHYPDQARTVSMLYEQVLSQCELAESEGYDCFYVAEHHFHEYGVVPNPLIMLASMAQRTSKIRLGTAISLLTFHDPLTLAESYCMLDQLSGGRLVLGTGSGYLKHEFEGYGIPLEEKRERFDEALTIIQMALSGERFSYSGQYRDVKEVKLNVQPVQDIPIYVAILNRVAAYHLGRKGQKIMTVPYASVDHFDEIGELVAEYRRGQEEAGISAHPDDITMALHTHVAESDSQARQNVAEAFDLYVATRLYAKSQTYDDIQHSGLALMGGVESVRQKVLQLREMGVNNILTLQNFGMLSPDLVRQSMCSFARDVMMPINAQLIRVES